MTVGGGEAADQMVRMMLSSGEVAVRLTGSALKNLLALTMALARNNQTLSGKVNMTRMLKETRDLRLFPMSPEQYKQFAKLAKKQKILFSAIKDKDGKGKVVDVVLPVTELDRANLIFERIMYQGITRQAPEREERPIPGRERTRPERSPGRDRQPPQAGRDEPEGDISPKKDSRSERDSHDTRTKSSTRSDSRENGTMNDRPSILEQLQGFREQLSRGSQSVPTRDKTKAKPKQR